MFYEINNFLKFKLPIKTEYNIIMKILEIVYDNQCAHSILHSGDK